MDIALRLVARWRRKLPPGATGGNCRVQLPAAATIGDLLEHMDIPRAGTHMILVNGKSAGDLDHQLQDGDVVSVFPPVAGG